MRRIALFGACDNLGGTEVYMITMVRLLREEVRFDYIINHDSPEIPFEKEIISYGGKVYREYYMHRERNLNGYISPKQLIAKHSEWDGVYLNVQSIHTAYRFLVEAKKAGLKYRIIHAHNNGYSTLPRLKDKIYEQYFYLTQQKVVTHHLACSKSAGQWMFGKKAELYVIPNAVDFERFRGNPELRKTMRAHYKISNDKVVLGFCGRLTYQKRPDLLIEILHCLQNDEKYLLLIVGDGELKDTLLKKAEQYNLQNRIIFVGSTKTPELFYQMMDCFLLPSRYEGFGIVLLEAQAAGLRCYTTAETVPSEVNVTGRVHFLPLNAGPDIWADAIQKYGTDRVNCLAVLEQSEYSLSTMHEKLRKVFFDAVSSVSKTK